MYYLGLTMVKVSILIQFQRFFIGKTIRRVCWVLLAIVIAYGIYTSVGTALTCLPVAYFWDKTVPGGYCLNLLAFWFTNATLNIITDITICILPIPTLKALQLPKRQKYSLMVVFALGGL